MIPVVFNGNPAFLLDDEPDWSAGCQLDATIPAAFERGLSGRETRRPTGDTLRLEFSYDTVAQGVAVTNLRNSLQALNTQPVLCPLWTHPFAAGAPSPVTAAWYVLIGDDAAPSIQPASALPFTRPACPLLVGRLVEIPDPAALCSDLVQLTLKFIENDATAITPPAIINLNGPVDATGAARPLLPLTPDWGTSPHTGASEVDLTRRNIGQSRSTSDAYYTQPSRRLLTQSFVLSGGDDLTLLRFWLDRGGERENFWLPAGMVEARLTADVTAIAASLTVDNGAALGGNTAIILIAGGSRVPLKISSVAGNTWNLAAAPGTAFAAVATMIESLVLCRFNALKLSLTYAAPGYATCTSKFIETSAEVTVIEGETAGTTMGALPPTAIFFKFTMTTPSATTTWFFTGYERNLSDGANNWLSAAMEFDTITETADLKRNETTITSRNFAGNPLSLLFPLSLEWPLMVEIFEGDVNTAASTVSNLREYFYGEVGEADMEPPFISAKCATLSHIFDRQLPRRLYQQTDNWCLFEPANGLSPADWEWDAVVVSYDNTTCTLVIGTITSTNPAALGNHYFAAGYFILTAASNGAQQVRMVSDSTALAGGEITLQLSTPLKTAPAVGDTLALYPGYDGQADTSKNKFNNYQQKFGGFPFMPVGNPSVLRITQPSGGGKK